MKFIDPLFKFSVLSAGLNYRNPWFELANSIPLFIYLLPPIEGLVPFSCFSNQISILRFGSSVALIGAKSPCKLKHITGRPAATGWWPIHSVTISEVEYEQKIILTWWNNQKIQWWKSQNHESALVENTVSFNDRSDRDHLQIKLV